MYANTWGLLNAVYVMANFRKKNLKVYIKSAHEGKRPLNGRHICNVRVLDKCWNSSWRWAALWMQLE